MAMNRGQAIDRINQGLGFRTSLRSTIANALMDAQVLLEAEEYLPKFLVVNQQSLVTIADTETVALPTGFLREAEDDGPLWYLDADNGLHELHKDDMAYLRTVFIGSGDVATTGAPRMYALGASNLHIFPRPDAIYNLRFSFYKAEPILDSDGIENKWLQYAHDIMIGMAGKELAADLRDINAINIFTNMEARGRNRLKGNAEAREAEGRRYVMGGDD